ncbi:hypothetical protein PtrSN002B_009123 [Pyrenophora tritici-repentis]|uniref:Uncharacterized protein n=2 Tax=Pyrenophora tritici-repentis TaxID=45151 RepID=A0A2W1D9T2_9PLEO|nr:uncharacterized protein PTRG_01371 [Pyrenophora tritici-repentis Pt-1C-BFP]KAA8626022.1 hypothetical protein PtrV1_01702 [Pyrenophora tritici-repentis]EDU40809.1 hypothetical protein PTRG_01371 [Pyrenophora tritici-repentis Pt-1C-BFP]KAF7577556.1 hypothetical protein PtrM4_017960 [Pyrenophora tritici-repentis]KAG9388182.1 hypothetical protein A1F94_001074 [Pyrenophora tritici-repentis]KAI0580235.1 hypothetical protein Alg130_07138 [Pyrenophora tritici-repentis]
MLSFKTIAVLLALTVSMPGALAQCPDCARDFPRGCGGGPARCVRMGATDTCGC